MNHTIHTHGTANPEAVFTFDQTRISVLTERMLRIEISPNGRFEDRPSQAFWYRQQPRPDMHVVHTDATLQIETPNFTLQYDPAGGVPTHKTFAVTLKENGMKFHLGDENDGILPGTARTLDESNGAIHLVDGFLSRSGWVLIDDTPSLVFNKEGWIEPRNFPKQYQDQYLLISGSDYKAALYDYQRVAGKVPLIPRYLLGNWWSRFWEYTQQDVINLVGKFQEERIPLSVFVLDMDWHKTKTSNACTGWTGFSWNRTLFPQPAQLLQWLHDEGLAVTLNLHPAEGIYPHEERYEPMAKSMGKDTTDQSPIPFDCSDAELMKTYFEQVLKPLEKDGVDFWWLDWQQGDTCSLPDLDPLWWLNHLHFYEQGKKGNKRPFVFSRWGGPGNHRYPIGFSGDTIVSWDSLAFQPYFTATAANAAYGWWSHDLGGHMRGQEDAELYIRWLQFGLFSPIFRIHSGKDIFSDHQPWAFGDGILSIARDIMQFRHQLIPYLYSMAQRNAEDGIPLCTPMYYDFPEENAAYQAENEYMFGDQVLYAPITSPALPSVNRTRQVAWFPPGDWYHLLNGTRFQGNVWRTQYHALHETAAYAKAGAIIPLQPALDWGGIENPAKIDLLIFPGEDESFDLYEDDGISKVYKSGKYCKTHFHSEWGERSLSLDIDAVDGDRTLIPQKREFHLLFRGICKPQQYRIWIDGVEKNAETYYDAETHTFTIGPVTLEPHQRFHAILQAESDLRIPLYHSVDDTIPLMKAFTLPTMVKMRIYEALDQLKKNCDHLQQWQHKLSVEQYNALLETITGCACHASTSHTGQQQLIFSNPEKNKTFMIRNGGSSWEQVPQEGILFAAEHNPDDTITIHQPGLPPQEFNLTHE